MIGVEIFNMQLSPAAQHKTLFDGNYRLRLKRKPSVLVIIACGSKNPLSIKKNDLLPPSMLPRLSNDICTTPD